eukprot:XP_001695314.1 predicted protein [Chlamydomonas reinhardtii]
MANALLLVGAWTRGWQSTSRLKSQTAIGVETIWSWTFALILACVLPLRCMQAAGAARHPPRAAAVPRPPTRRGWALALSSRCWRRRGSWSRARRCVRVIGAGAPEVGWRAG